MVELCNKSCCLVIFTGHALVSQDLRNSNDLFNVGNVLFIVMDGVSDLSDGRDNSVVSFNIVCEGNCCVYSAKWLNEGTKTWNLWYGGFNVLLV